jgi:hypothetical protein
MSKVYLKDLKPGKKYKLVVEVDTEFDTINSYPAIEFTVPNAPPASKVNNLLVTQEIKNISGQDRTIVNSGSVKYRPRGDMKREMKVVGTTPHGLEKGDIVDISGTIANYNATGVSVLAVYVDRNSFEYNDDGTTGISSSDTWSSTDTDATIVEKNGTAKPKQITEVQIRIPDAVINNLIWNDTVRDFVHIVFRSGDDKTDISGPRYYINSSGTELTSTPRYIDLDGYASGMPKISTKQISDKKYYEFQYIIARYILVGSSWSTTEHVSKQWLEPGPNKNRLSNAVSWGA